MRLQKTVLLMALLMPVTGFCAKWQVPSNVATTADGKYMESVDFSYHTDQPGNFSKLKMCIAENITNGAVSLQDSAGSFVGPATGTYYNNAKSQTVQGGGIFKYVDETNSALIASGTADGGSAAFGLTRDIVKFDLKVAVESSTITLRFNNITRAQQNTGSVANNGFTPVGMWRGAGAQRIYESLDAIEDKIKTCVQ
ncbi:MAG: hypothetical protein QM769_03900 [Pseudoxanthomonas sp.]